MCVLKKAFIKKNCHMQEGYTVEKRPTSFTHEHLGSVSKYVTLLGSFYIHREVQFKITNCRMWDFCIQTKS